MTMNSHITSALYEISPIRPKGAAKCVLLSRYCKMENDLTIAEKLTDSPLSLFRREPPTEKNRHMSEYKHSLTFRVRCHVVIVTILVHRLQISPILHNYRAPRAIPPSYIRVRVVMWECGEGQAYTQTDTQTAVTTEAYITRRLRLTRKVIRKTTKNKDWLAQKIRCS